MLLGAGTSEREEERGLDEELGRSAQARRTVIDFMATQGQRLQEVYRAIGREEEDTSIFGDRRRAREFDRRLTEHIAQFFQFRRQGETERREQIRSFELHEQTSTQIYDLMGQLERINSDPTKTPAQRIEWYNATYVPTIRRLYSEQRKSREQEFGAGRPN